MIERETFGETINIGHVRKTLAVLAIPLALGACGGPKKETPSIPIREPDTSEIGYGVTHNYLDNGMRITSVVTTEHRYGDEYVLYDNFLEFCDGADLRVTPMPPSETRRMEIVPDHAACEDGELTASDFSK